LRCDCEVLPYSKPLTSHDHVPLSLCSMISHCDKLGGKQANRATRCRLPRVHGPAYR